VNVLAVALADESQRFTKGYPPRGSRLFLQPNVEILRVAALLRPGDDLRYVDERVESLEDYRTPNTEGAAPGAGYEPTICLIHIGLGQDHRARELAHAWADSGCAPVFFGPQVTSWRDSQPDWCQPRVVGDITNVWPELRADAESGRLQPLYRASDHPGYIAPRQVTKRGLVFRGALRDPQGLSPLQLNPELNSDRQTIQFVRGCSCPEPVKQFCSEHLYYGTNTLVRTPDEVIGEVITLPGKRIHLLDDDVAALPDYYLELFSRLRNYHRQWVVNASDRLFEHPRLVRILSKAGTKLVYLNESFLLDSLNRAASSHQAVHRLYRRVKSLQASKMLVGARLAIPTAPATPTDYEKISSVLRQIDVDFIEPRFLGPDGSLARVVYRPMITSREPAWLKNRFYSIETIADRMIRRPRRVGVFTTAVYLLPYSAAYRQSFLEGLPWP